MNSNQWKIDLYRLAYVYHYVVLTTWLALRAGVGLCVLLALAAYLESQSPANPILIILLAAGSLLIVWRPLLSVPGLILIFL